MKKWICYFLFGTLVLSSFLAAGTSIKDQQKAQSALDISVNDYTPILFYVNITVFFDGANDFQLEDVHIPYNNWTGSEHNFTIRVTIHNKYNNTGSDSFWWRIAEWPDSPYPMLIFFLTHGCVRPIIPQLIMTKQTVQWQAADDDVTIKDYTYGIIIEPDCECEICLLVWHPPCNWHFSSLFLTHMIM